MAINTSPHSGTINPPPIRHCKTFSSCMCVLSCFVLFCHTQIYSFHSKSNPFCSRSQGQTQVEAQGGPGPLGSKKKKKNLVIIFFIFVVRSPFSTINLISLTQIATTQPKNLTKTIKIITMVIVFQPKNKNYFTTKKPKNNVLLEKLKLKFLQLQ